MQQVSRRIFYAKKRAEESSACRLWLWIIFGEETRGGPKAEDAGGPGRLLQLLAEAARWWVPISWVSGVCIRGSPSHEHAAGEVGCVRNWRPLGCRSSRTRRILQRRPKIPLGFHVRSISDNSKGPSISHLSISNDNLDGK